MKGHHDEPSALDEQLLGGEKPVDQFIHLAVDEQAQAAEALLGEDAGDEVALGGVAIRVGLDALAASVVGLDAEPCVLVLDHEDDAGAVAGGELDLGGEVVATGEITVGEEDYAPLLAALADEFRSQGHDMKKLIRTIVRSRAYQLTSVPNETNRHDTTNYSHFQPRPLDAELFLDAISFVTGVTDEKYLDTTRGHEPVGTRAMNLKNWSIDHSQFMEVHGRYDRAGKPNRPGPTLLQALHSFSGRTYNEKIGREGGRLDRMIRSGRSNEEIVEELYLLAFTRFPSRDELDRLLRLIEESPSRETTLEDLTWALISSREFAYNH